MSENHYKHLCQCCGKETESDLIVGINIDCLRKFKGENIWVTIFMMKKVKWLGTVSIMVSIPISKDSMIVLKKWKTGWKGKKLIKKRLENTWIL
mgnify:CR=1 FL=1